MSLDRQKMILLWNQYIWLFEQLEGQWKKIQAEVEANIGNATEFQYLPVQVQKGLSFFGRSQFSVMLSRFVDYYRTQGGVSQMKVDIKKEREDARREEIK